MTKRPKVGRPRSPRLTPEQLDAVIAENRRRARAEMVEYHRGLAAKHGYVPRWAGPFCYCGPCDRLYPEMCADHRPEPQN